ncbi:MAG: Uma2 family endonuclease [Armatimonadetes bacterium]|nr:Uma2 family endonuclease [Armatimonadota bacterium]
MTQVAKAYEEIEEPDVSHLITEDDEPVDNPFSEKQQRLLVQCLYASWTEEMREGRPFVAFANVGLFFVPKNPALVPDVQVSLDVQLPEDLWEKRHRSYMTWVYGKPPELVIELVSSRTGGEVDRKFKEYSNQGVAYYAIFDPQRVHSSRQLRVYELHGRRYVEMLDAGWLPGACVGLKLWDGTFEEHEATWLRWCDPEGQLLLLPEEHQERATQAAHQARQEAEQARHEAARAEQEAARLRARLRELGQE